MRDLDVTANERQKKMFFWVTVSLLLIFLASMLAHADEAIVLQPVEETKDIVGLVAFLFNAAKNGHWLAFGAGLGMLIAFGVQKYLTKKKKSKDE